MKLHDASLGQIDYSPGRHARQKPLFTDLIGKMQSRFPLNGINVWLFFAIIFLYHVSLTFQGIDLLDEGFHVVFYQRIFTDPASVQYSFFYWFSGILGGLVLKITPGLGLWGLRLAGSLVSLATIFIVYQMLKNTISRGVLQTGIVFLSLYINTEPKDIHYNTISALLYFLSAFFMFKGLKNEKQIYLLLSGFIVSLNFFARLPNILDMGISLAIIYDGIMQNKKKVYIFRGIIYFLSGFILSTLIVLSVMYMIGHLSIYVNSLKYLFSLTTTTDKQDGLSGSYSIFRLMYIPIKQHAICVSVVASLAGFLILFKNLADSAMKYRFQKMRLDLIFWFLLSVSFLALIFTDRIQLQSLTYLFTGFCMITSMVYLFGKYSYENKLLSFLGIFIMIVHPLGSAPGIMTVMIYSVWLSFPMGISLLKSLFGQDISLKFSIGKGSENQIWFEKLFLRKVLLWFGTFILIICIRQIFVFPYFYDKHNRITMVYGINSPNMRFIYTSALRAEALNELLAKSKTYIKEGDAVLAYDAIPMFHFMTGTKPYLPNSTPFFYTNQQFNIDLHEAIKKNRLPVVVQQKIWMVHEGSSWPENIYENNYQQESLDKERNAIFYKYLDVNDYQEVWSNKIFRILIPRLKPE